MSTQMESDLRLALVERAARLPDGASERVLSADYPVRNSIARPALALGVVGLLVCVALVLSSIGIDQGPTRAFAGWSAAPTEPAAGQVAGADRACRSRLPTSARIERAQRTAKGNVRPWPIPRIDSNSWRTVLVDTRGPYTTILYEADGGRAHMDCLSGRYPGEASLGGGFGVRAPARVPPGRARVISSGFTTTAPREGSHQFSSLVGRTGSGVNTVEVKLADGRELRATASHGWFLAWWPGRESVRRIEASGSHGRHGQRFDDPRRAVHRL